MKLQKWFFAGLAAALLPWLLAAQAQKAKPRPLIEELVAAHREVESTKRGWPVPHADPAGQKPLRRRLYLSDRLPRGGMLVDRRVPILFNRDVVVLLAAPDASDDAAPENDP